MKKDRFYILSTKSQTETLTKEEQFELEKLISLYPEFQHEQEFIANFWSESKFSMEADGDKAYQGISQYIDANKEIKIFSMWPKMAAAVVLLLVFGIAAILIQNQIVLKDTLESMQSEMVEKEVPLGKKMRVSLPDGSIVWLNSGSKVIYPAKFSGDSRKIELIGEAYFEVEKDANRPFQVTSNNVVTTALGTAFNINSNSEKGQVQVSLATGKVRVDQYLSNKNNMINKTHYLTPGQEICYKENSEPELKKYNWEEIFGWRDGLIYFKNANQRKVLQTLEKWYGVDIVVEDKFSNPWNVTAKFRGKSLENVLQSISYTVGFDYEIENKKVKIKTNR